MRKRLVNYFSVSLLFTSVSITYAAEPMTIGQRVAASAEKARFEAKQSTYDHHIEINVRKGIYRTDCSGLVEHILHGFPGLLEAIKRPPQHRRPLAEDFYQTFHDAPLTSDAPWQRVERVTDVLPGDIIAWKSLTHEDGDHADTGHVMVIVSMPTPQAKPTESGIVVIDSTKSAHDADTRKAGNTGVGRGTIYLEADNAGHPIGFHWRNPNGEMRENPIAIARPQAIDRPTSGPTTGESNWGTPRRKPRIWM